MEQRVLVFAPVGQDAALAERVLQSAGIQGRCCPDDADLAAQLADGAGAVLVVEEALAGAAGAALVRHLAAQPPWSDLPVLVMTKRGADSLQAQRALEQLGNVTLLERPVRTIALVSAARSALRARERQYQMRALSRRKDEFLATLAHELRNPLAPIANAMAVLDRLHPTPQTANLTSMVNRQVRHLTRLVDDLLDVARITSGKLELKLGPTSAAQVAAHALEIAQGALQAKGHRVATELPAQAVPLRADHVRLVQGVSNLLVNAAKFTPPGGEITLQVRRHGEVVEFSVRDTGQGLEPGDAERIFDMFEQVHAIGEPSGGLGLGLHLTRAFAQLHGGTVSVRSDGAGRGSEFVLRIPAGCEGPLLQAGTTAGAGPRLPGKVLVVDDNVDAAMALEALLALHGVAVAVAHDGAAAVARAREGQPDAIVMDIGMPVMNGYEAARRIRGDTHGHQPLLIALTGWGQYADKARASAAGFDHHLVKPVDFQRLLECLAAPRPQAA